jgi:PAS domain-containing protein
MASKRKKPAATTSPAVQKQVERIGDEPESGVQQTFHQSEEGFRQLVEGLPHIAFSASAQGEINYFNERWYVYTGIAREESFEESWRRVVHPADQKQLVSQ